MKWIYILVITFVATQLLGQGYKITSYSIHIDVTEDAQLHVNEIIDVEFLKKSRGIIRSFPLKYTIQNQKHKIAISNVEVENYKYKTSRKNGDFNIRIGSADKYISGYHTYAIDYVVEGAILNYPEYMELYWDLIGDKWDVAIEETNFTIDLPDHIGIDTNRIHVEQASVIVPYTFNNNQIKGKSKRILDSGEALTIGVAFEKDAFMIPEKVSRQGEEFTYNPLKEYALSIPLLLFSWIMWFWNKNGRTKKYNVVEEQIFYPPSDLSPAEVGTYIDHKTHTRDIISLLPYWAQKKLVHIKQSNEEIYVGKLESIPEDYPQYQQYMFNALFVEKDMIGLKEFKSSLPDIISKTSTRIKEQIMDLKVYDSDAVRVFNGRSVWMCSLLSIFIGIFIGVYFKWILTGVAFGIIGIAGLSIYGSRPRLNPKGQKLLGDLNNFKKTIENLDDQKTQRLYSDDPFYFEKIYPYAVALEIDDKFTNKFSKLMEESPSWYNHSDVTGPVGFSNFKDDFEVKSIRSHFTPDSSRRDGGGYSGGGGFSGGGMGGGGGSSW